MTVDGFSLFFVGVGADNNNIKKSSFYRGENRKPPFISFFFANFPLYNIAINYKRYGTHLVIYLMVTEFLSFFFNFLLI